ncbi:oxygenase MpaB family protein [Streptomyces sp. NPDC002851]
MTPSAAAPRPDPGFFGPRSVTWHLHSDPIMWIAGVRALYLQALHPRVVRGVLENSDYRKDPWGRLLRTASFVGTLSYGTTEDAEHAGARIRALHHRLKATDPATGERYAVDEPELLLWVHCAEIDSYTEVGRRSGFPLTPALEDRYIDEQRISARLVGLDPDAVPANRAELDAYFTRMRPALTAGDDARTVDAFIRRPPTPPLLAPARELLWRHMAADLAYAALPPYAHELYGRPAPAPGVTDHRLRAAGNSLRCIPARIRWRIPPQHILHAMDRLGPGSRPAPYKLRRDAAILD